MAAKLATKNFRIILLHLICRKSKALVSVGRESGTL